MAEQVGLATIGSNRAVHLDEGVTLALRGGVNEASQDVFTDTGFATDQEGRPRLRTLSSGHEVKDPSGLQNGRDTLGRRVLSGHLPAPPGAHRLASEGVSLLARRDVPGRQTVQ